MPNGWPVTAIVLLATLTIIGMGLLRAGSQETIVEHCTISREDCDLAVIHARPEGMPRGGVVLHPDIFGVRPLFEDISRRLASHGFAVACIEPFARIERDVRERSADDAATRMTWVSNLRDVDQLGDLEAAANFLVVEDDVSKVGILGFCMGGMYAMKAAALERFDAAVAFYGMIRVPELWRGPGLAEPLATIGAATKTLAIFGSVDAWTPADDIAALRAAWHERPDCEIVVVEGADHGFVHAPERPAHRGDDAELLWQRTLDWFSSL